jgi:hypothetical protein
MKTHRPLATALLAVLVGFAALPQTSLAGTETRNVAEFSSIALRNHATVKVSQGNTASVQVDAADDLLPLLETVVDGGRLEIRWKRGESYDRSMRHRGPVTITVVTPRLTGLSVAGSGDIELGAFNTPKLSVSVAGSGSARLDGLASDEVGISVAGSGDIKGSGKTSALNINIAGSGDVDLGGLKADEVSVRIAGSGDVEVHANKALKISIAGSGDVVYSGDATVSRSVMGSGSVKKR